VILGYFLIPLTTLITAVVGSIFTKSGMIWYGGINLPSWTLSGKIIGIIWTIIFILATISALIVWQKQKKIRLVIPFFLLNAFLNVTWSFLFFFHNLIFSSAVESILLVFSVLLLTALIWTISKMASILLVPYLLWTSFAAFLTFVIWRLNLPL